MRRMVSVLVLVLGLLSLVAIAEATCEVRKELLAADKAADRLSDVILEWFLGKLPREVAELAHREFTEAYDRVNDRCGDVIRSRSMELEVLHLIRRKAEGSSLLLSGRRPNDPAVLDGLRASARLSELGYFTRR